MSPERIVERWLPRLGDESEDVQTEAAKKLAEVAQDHPQFRPHLIPVLLATCRSDVDWVIVCNSIFFHLSEIPKSDKSWLDAFIDTYLFLAKKNEYVTGEHAFGYMWDLIDQGHIDEEHPRFQEILTISRAGLKVKKHEARKPMMAIVDWYEDRH